MAGIMDTILKGLSSTDSVKTYQHATRIFVDSNMLRSPKYAFLFYVVFDYDDSLNGLATPASRGVQIGALCKSAQLPKFTIETQTNNAYNRQNITQKRIKYDPINLKFHDDSDDIIREFWYDYMSFYYRDSDYQTPIYNQDHKYADRQKDAWGYGLRTQQDGLQPKVNYRPLKAIRIYSFYRKRFSEYMLINPTISSFRHGEHTSEGSGLMEHEMTVQYEAVKYAVGYVSPDTFGNSMLLLYDLTPSALSAGSTRSIFGAGGLVQTIDNTFQDLANGNYAAAFLKINRATQTFKGANLQEVLRSETADNLLNRTMQRGTNPLSTVNAPYVGGSSLLGLGLVAYASGGVASVSNNRTGQQNNLGPQITIARSTPARIDQASASADYRAVSGGQYVTQPYRPVQQRPQFPLLPTISPTVRNGVRSTAISNNVTASEVASQNINLNKSSTVISGSKQGTPAIQVPPRPLMLSDTDPLVIGLTIPATLDELNEATDLARIARGNAQLQRIMSSSSVQKLLANDFENKRAADILVQNAFTPGIGASTYGSETAWLATKETLLTKLEELGTPETQNIVAEWTQLKLQLQAAADADDKTALRELLVELSAFGKTLAIRSAYANLIDMVALSNDIASIANGDAATAINFDITNYWITS
jgi:hypothetical protein